MIAEVSGAGNAFLLVWGEEKPTGLCGPDGLIWLRQDLSMRFYNPDGNEAALCGNGVRCAARFLIETQGKQPPFTITSACSEHRILWENGLIGVEMPRPKPFERVVIEGTEFFTTEVGVPHAYHCLSGVDEFDLDTFGRRFVAHPHFPEGSNINILEIGERLRLRTFERGVNRETKACGTGAVGAAALAQKGLVQAVGGVLEVRGDFLFGPTKICLIDKQNIC